MLGSERPPSALDASGAVQPPELAPAELHAHAHAAAHPLPEGALALPPFVPEKTLGLASVASIETESVKRRAWMLPLDEWGVVVTPIGYGQ